MRVFLAFLLSLFAAPAFAGPLVHADISGINYESGNYYGGIGVGNWTDIGPAGRFLFTGTDVATGDPFSAYTFCIDVFTGVGTSNYMLAPVGARFGSVAKQRQLAGLLSHVDGILASAVDYDARNASAAALQLAVWELVYEPTTTGYSVASGNFYTFGDPTTNNYFVPLWGEANGYLSNVESGAWTSKASQVQLLLSESAQSQIFLGAGGVPEPSTWAMMMMGVGAAGAMLRRRKATTITLRGVRA